MKIVINVCYGGFRLSEKGMKRYAELRNILLYTNGDAFSKTYWTVPPDQFKKYYDWYNMRKNKGWRNSSKKEKETDEEMSQFYRDNTIYDRDLERTDPILVQVVEELGKEANGMCAELSVVDIPTGTAYRIKEYDGMESIEYSDAIQWSVAK